MTGLRKGSATLFYPWWHKDFENLIVLKNNKGTEDNRVRHLDYGVQLNKFFYEAVRDKENLCLFCPEEAKGLYEAFFEDQDKFKELYLKYKNDSSISRKEIPAKDMLISLLQERSSTGRIYIQNVDHCNDHGPFDKTVAPIRQSNLCLEIALPTKPLQTDGSGEIALCTLAAFNLGAITEEELPELSRIIVRALDNLLDYQGYPVKQAEESLKRRALGVGVINYAYWLAKQGLKYSDGSGIVSTHTLFEKMQYNLVKASVELAKERGACKYSDQTLYGQGQVPLDWYNKNVDTLTGDAVYTCDWESLRVSLEKYGIRNSTLTALMPAETSALVASATNGIEPPRALTVTKKSKDGSFKVVVPDVQKLYADYELVWDIKDNTGYIELCAVMQKFVDQAISANTNYDPNSYDGGKVPIKVLTKDMFKAYKLGLKTLYYHNTRDGSGEDQDDGCSSGACKI